jgi:BlaI family transcriptional regulator, penicillinase repressor
MSKRIADVTDTEFSILAALWERGPVTVRDIVETLYGRHTPSLHATVKSLLDRLAHKGYVASDRRGFAHRYLAKVDRQTFVGQRLQQIADAHFGGSLAPMLLALVERSKLSKSDRHAIRRIIEEIE